MDTKDVFIEVTATDRHKADIVLATLCAMFSEHCARPFEVEPVEVVDALGHTRSEPHAACFSLQAWSLAIPRCAVSTRTYRTACTLCWAPWKATL